MVRFIRYKLRAISLNVMNKKIKKLPQAVFFSDRKLGYDLKDVVTKLPPHAAIIIRDYDLNFNQRYQLAKEVMRLARPLKIKVLIGKDLRLAQRVKADGVHFSDYDHLPLSLQNKAPRSFIFSFACHHLQSIMHAKNLGADMVFISPIFQTKSHENVKAIGLENLQQYLLKISFKTKSRFYCKHHLYALGGINLTTIASIQKLDLAGYGAIRLFMEK